MSRTVGAGPLGAAKLEGLFLWVKDFKGMREFYHGTLGLPIRYENPHFCALKAGSTEVALHAEREGHRVGDNWFISFLVKDIDSVVAEFRSRGVKVGPILEEDFGRIASLEDPEGNTIGLEEPRRSG